MSTIARGMAASLTLQGASAFVAPQSISLRGATSETFSGAVKQHSAAANDSKTYALGVAAGLTAIAAVGHVKKTGRVQKVSRRVATTLVEPKVETSTNEKNYGDHVFKGAVAEPYLERYGLTLADLEDPSWCLDAIKPDVMARAVADWATDHGATVF